MAAAIVAGPPKKTNWLATGGGGIAGGALGLLAGPIGAAVGLATGGAAGFFFGSKVAALLPPLTLQSITHETQGGTPVPPAVPTKTMADQVATSGVAVAAAHALYAYLKVHGPDGSAELAILVVTFQGMTNSDPQALQLSGNIGQSAIYDVKTSAALTLYSHDPIPPATPPAPQPPPTPAQVADIYYPGAAATSGFNLYTYLKAHAPHSPTDGSLNKLCHQFQIDVNTDPKFPGPACVPGQGILMRLVNAKLPETGAYDAATAAALTVMSNDAIAP